MMAFLNKEEIAASILEARVCTKLKLQPQSGTECTKGVRSSGKQYFEGLL